MKTKLLLYTLLLPPTFYQLDYRQRLEAEVSVPGIFGFVVKKSIETRYRPSKETRPILKVKVQGKTSSDQTI